MVDQLIETIEATVAALRAYEMYNIAKEVEAQLIETRTLFQRNVTSSITCTHQLQQINQAVLKVINKVHPDKADKITLFAQELLKADRQRPA